MSPFRHQDFDFVLWNRSHNIRHIGFLIGDFS